MLKDFTIAATVCAPNCAVSRSRRGWGRVRAIILKISYTLFYMESLSPQDLKVKRDGGASVTVVDLQAPEGYAHRHIPVAIYLDPAAVTE